VIEKYGSCQSACVASGILSLVFDRLIGISDNPEEPKSVFANVNTLAVWRCCGGSLLAAKKQKPFFFVRATQKLRLGFFSHKSMDLRIDRPGTAAEL
jgi:hypothetical protein